MGLYTLVGGQIQDRHNRHKTSLKTRQTRIVRKLDTYDLS